RVQGEFSTGQGGKAVENGGYCQPFVPRRSLGRPARGFSTQPPRDELCPGSVAFPLAAQGDGDRPDAGCPGSPSPPSRGWEAAPGRHRSRRGCTSSRPTSTPSSISTPRDEKARSAPC